jgi:hypothetical protein
VKFSGYGSSSPGNIIKFSKVSKLPRDSLSIGSFQKGSLDSGYLQFLRAAQMLNLSSCFCWPTDSCAFITVVSASSSGRFEWILRFTVHFSFSLVHEESATLSGLWAAVEGY